MRIAILTNCSMPPSEGIGWHIHETARRLNARGHRVTILARGTSFNSWENKVAHGVLIRHYPYLGLRPFQHEISRRAIQRWLDHGAGGAEVLHVHLPLMPPLRTKLPMITTFHSPMLTDTAAIGEPGLKAKLIRSNAQWFSHRKESWYLKHSDQVIAVSQGVHDELKSQYPDANRPISVIENGVDHEFFSPDHNQPVAPSILYVGRLGYRKGLLRLLEAFSLLAHRLPVNLELVGDGPLRPVIVKRAQQLGLMNRIKLSGFQNRTGIRAALRRAACFVNPADYESGPLTLLEALATETPVVSTRTGLAAEFGDEMPIWPSDPDPSSLAQQIELAWCERPRARHMASTCRQQVISRFNWDRSIDALEQLYLPGQELAA